MKQSRSVRCFFLVLAESVVRLGDVVDMKASSCPPTVYPWYLLRSRWIITHKYSLYRAYIGISHGGTLVGVHPTIPIFLLLYTLMSQGLHDCFFFWCGGLVIRQYHGNLRVPPLCHPPPRNSRPY